MHPINMLIPAGWQKVTYGVHPDGTPQENVIALPTLVTKDGSHVLSEWDLSDEDRAHIAAGGRIRLWQQTGGAPLQPQKLEVIPRDEVLPLEPTH